MACTGLACDSKGHPMGPCVSMLNVRVPVHPAFMSFSCSTAVVNRLIKD